MYKSLNSENAQIAPLTDQDWLMLEELFHNAHQEAIAQIETISSSAKGSLNRKLADREQRNKPG